MVATHLSRYASGGFQGFRPWAAAFAAFAVAACATTSEPRIVVKEVRVPVPVKCAADPGPAPDLPDTSEALRQAPDLFEQVKLLLAGRKLRDARIGELEAANQGCR